MRFISWTIAAVTLACSSGVALAETAPTPEDFSFAMGQMAGSETACDIPKDQVNAMISKAFDKMKIEIKEGTPLFDKFTAGVTDGAKSVKDGAASCPDVKAGFDTFSAQISQ